MENIPPWLQHQESKKLTLLERAEIARSEQLLGNYPRQLIGQLADTIIDLKQELADSQKEMADLQFAMRLANACAAVCPVTITPPRGCASAPILDEDQRLVRHQSHWECGE